MKSIFNVVTGLFIVCSMFLGIANAQEPATVLAQELTLERKKWEPLKVGMAPGFAPFEFKNDKGEWNGFDVDIAKELATVLGTKLEIVEKKWEDLITALTQREIDVIISGMSITLDRARIVYFSQPYFETGQVVLLLKGKEVNLNQKRLEIGVLTESTGEKIATKEFPEAKIVYFSVEAEIVKALVNQEVKAMVIDKPYADNLVRKDERIEMLPQLLEIEKYAFAIRRGDLDFLFYLNHFIDYLKYTGRYQEICSKWFK